MMIDFDKIKDAFRGKAWAYIVMYHAVEIGVWDDNKLAFFSNEFDEDCCLELRVFDKDRELRFLHLPDNSFALRDTAEYTPEQDKESSEVRYIMYGYGETPISENNWTALSETRGGKLYFPKKLDIGNDKIRMKLGVKNYYRYNEVPVGKSDESYETLENPGRGALEYYDYCLTGFYIGASETEVLL